jgi:hypothetical protein
MSIRHARPMQIESHTVSEGRPSECFLRSVLEGNSTMPMQMDRGARLWMLQYARRSFWKVSSYIDLDDLIQEGYLAWHRVSIRYPDITERKHMMSLFQRTFCNLIVDIAKQRTKEAHLNLPFTQEVSDYNSHMFEHGISTLYVMLQQAPAPVRKVMELLATDVGRKKLCSLHRMYSDGKRETTNDRLRRLTKEQGDIVQMIKDYFSPEKADESSLDKLVSLFTKVYFQSAETKHV